MRKYRIGIYPYRGGVRIMIPYRGIEKFFGYHGFSIWDLAPNARKQGLQRGLGKDFLEGVFLDWQFTVQ